MKISTLLTVLLMITGLLMIRNQNICAQSLQVVRYSSDEGLTNTLVKSVATDPNGLIWVATDGGLFFFDGKEFTRCETELPSPFVKSVFCRANGDIFVSTDMGILKAGHGVRPMLPELLFRGSVKQVDSLLWFPKGFYEDRQHRLWFGDNRKIYCSAGGRVRSYFPGEKAVTNNFQRSFSFAEDGAGHLFSFAEPGSIYLYNSMTDRFEEVRLPAPISNIVFSLTIEPRVILLATRTGLVEFRTGSHGECAGLTPVKNSPEISCLYQYAPGCLYAGTWANGLYEIKKEGTGYDIKPLEDVAEKNINSISKGSEGTIWIASDNGLLLLQRNLFASPFRSVTSSYTQCISGDEQGNCFFCDGDKVFSTRPGKTDYPSGSAVVIKKASATILQALPYNGGMWFSDVNACIRYEKPVGRVVKQFDFPTLGRAIFHLRTDRAGNLWACQDQNASLIRITPEFEIKTYGPKEGLTSRPLVTAMDSHGTIFAGGMTDTAYLFAYQAATDRFVNLSQPVRFEHNIDININDMAFGRDDVLWLGSSFGLLRFEQAIISRVDLGAMTGSSVKAVAADRNNNIWIGNSNGLCLFAGNELLPFDNRSGMSSKIISYRCLRVDDDNRLWAGTVDGVRVSAPLQPPKKTVTPVIFTILKNDKYEIPYTLSGTSFNNRSFATLKAGVIDFPFADFRVELFLQGRDSAWQPLPRSGSLILANLKPGSYTLLLRASKAGNYLSSDTLKWNFTVTRIWYTRDGVILLMVLVAGLLFWLGLYLYTLNLKRYNERLEKAIRERTRETIIQKERIEAQNASISLKNEELRQANIGLEEAKEVAEEASEAQKKFLSVMTHELRTPLNAVIGVAHLLIRNNPRPEQFNELQILRFSAENLLGLINNILDFTKIESGKVSLEKVRFNLRNLVEEIVSAFKIRADDKTIHLGCRIDEKIPDSVVGDPLRLSQIINNLMSNALKFTEQGSIVIELDLLERRGHEVLIGFQVRDTGIGMTRETLNSIFEMFVQGSSETTRRYGGTGLGLVITKKLLELHGSEIKAESTPGSGTQFSFSIRFEEVVHHAGDAPVNKEAYEYAPFNGQRILLVEDNKLNKMIASKFLSDWNLTVETADNGLIALDKFRNSEYDLVLMDIQMPEMDGYQASAGIRALGTETSAAVPIIALTAADLSDISALVFQSGMNDFISKPFNPVDLHRKIRKFLL